MTRLIGTEQIIRSVLILRELSDPKAGRMRNGAQIEAGYTTASTSWTTSRV